jgi:hypothetical protein
MVTRINYTPTIYIIWDILSLLFDPLPLSSSIYINFWEDDLYLKIINNNIKKEGIK